MALKKPKAAAAATESSEISENDKTLTEDAKTNIENGNERLAAEKPATASSGEPPTTGGSKPPLVKEKVNGLISLLGDYGSDSDDTD
jgi:hypothetical protein